MEIFLSWIQRLDVKHMIWVDSKFNQFETVTIFIHLKLGQFQINLFERLNTLTSKRAFVIIHHSTRKINKKGWSSTVLEKAVFHSCIMVF